MRSFGDTFSYMVQSRILLQMNLITKVKIAVCMCQLRMFSLQLLVIKHPTKAIKWMTKQTHRRVAISEFSNALKRYNHPLQYKNNVNFAVDAMIVRHNHQLQEQRSQFERLESGYHLSQKNRVNLRKQYANLREQRVELREKINTLEKQYKELDCQHTFTKDRYQYILSRVVQPYAKIKGLRWDDQSSATIDVVMDPLSNDVLEVTSLRQQVQVLQKELLARVEKTQSISDDQFAQDFRNLVALIKTMSRMIRHNEEVDVFEILGSPVLLSGVAQEYWTGRARKKCFIEAWIWSVLLDTVFKSPFAVFGNLCDDLSDTWGRYFRNESNKGWPRPSSVSEGWRCATMDRLLDIVEPSLITRGIHQGEHSMMRLSVLQARSNLLCIVGARLSNIDPAACFGQVRQIVDKAFSLALQMSLQRTRLQLTYPDVGATFNKDEISAVPDEDGEDIDEGVVKWVINPGLTKWGDAHGKNFDQRYDIVPALVQLEPVSTKCEPANTKYELELSTHIKRESE